jgi:hypothetical protein
MRERQVAADEDAVAAQEARIQQEVDQRVGRAREALARESRQKLKELQVEAEGRTAALRKEVAALGQQEIDAREARDSAQAELSLLQKQIADAESLVSKATEEESSRRTLRHMRFSMLEVLMTKANRALDAICEESIERSHGDDDADYLRFFTQVMTCIEDQAMRTRQLVKERSRGLLGRAFSRVFSNLFSSNPHFDFNTLIAPVPEITQEVVAHWVDHHVDKLVEEFPQDGDVPLIDAGDGGAGGDDGDDANDDASS